MDYKRIYFQIMETAKTRQLPAHMYTEKHHVLPRCMDGGNSKDNIVILTAREHFVSHWLLVKMHPDVWKLYYAFFQMTKKHTHGRVVSSRQFEIARKTLSTGAKMRYNLGLHPRKTDAGRKVLSQKMLGDNNPKYQCGANNNTAYPVCVVFTDGCEREFTHGKAAYEDLSMSRATWIQCLKKGQFHPRWNIKEVKLK